MLKLTGISKGFAGVQALSGVNFDVRAGEIHALVGENGAGKSTTIKIIAGALQPDAGEIAFDGKVVSWSGPADAKAAGIHVIYQEFVLFPHLTVAENIFLGHERRGRLGLIDHDRTRRDAADLLQRLGVAIDPDKIVSELTVADQQMVEISKALVHKVKLLILDEPTAVISGREADLLFARLAALKAEGVAIVYVSHRLEEIFQIRSRSRPRMSRSRDACAMPASSCAPARSRRWLAWWAPAGPNSPWRSSAACPPRVVPCGSMASRSGCSAPPSRSAEAWAS